MKQYLTIKDLSTMLQLKISTIYSLVYNKRIPYKKIGSGKRSALRFDMDEINNWINPEKAVDKPKKSLSSRKRIKDIDSIIQDAIADVVKS
ncbi:MAG: helix-turn-helix domain-containing protein [Thermodesulfovibrionales bacterium]|nr:helix-turn-helix domain-containing protein [Thermodesulfovibrionales bacterium]